LFDDVGAEAADVGWRHCENKSATVVLVNALCDMLRLVSQEGTVNIVTIISEDSMDANESEISETKSTAAEGDALSKNPENGVANSCAEPMTSSLSHAETQNLLGSQFNPPSVVVSPPKKQRLSHEEFHSSLGIIVCRNTQQLHDNMMLLDRKKIFQQRFAVLTFLYSLIMTKGIDAILDEVEDATEPLIDGIYGHGSQSLLNLQITGSAVSNVFDDERDLGGYKLCGIKKQAPIGFLSFLEHLRYCEVGWYLKNPVNPVWVLGSETHFTLLFSPEGGLIMKDSPITSGRRAFSQLDPEGNGFISADLLTNLLASLDLVSEPPEFVAIMKDKLDPEGLDIIVLNNFLREFYGDSEMDPSNMIPKGFQLYHYNGLRRNRDPKLVYSESTATIDEPGIIVTDATPIKMCLQTKWPTLEMNWKGGHHPSLN